MPHVLDALMAEAYALREGLLLAQQIGTTNFIVQSDCMQVVSTMQEGGFSATSAIQIFEDCRILWEGFDRVSIEHCNRNANQLAHELVRIAIRSKIPCIWVDESSSCVLNYLINDVTIFPNQ